MLRVMRTDRPEPTPENFAEPPLRLLPGAVCDACRRFFYTPISVDVPCYWCHAGTFKHRSVWVFAWCTSCSGGGCDACHWNKIVATPQ
jgi:hypothetical protein